MIVIQRVRSIVNRLCLIVIFVVDLQRHYEYCGAAATVGVFVGISGPIKPSNFRYINKYQTKFSGMYLAQ
jgi:hypothetical protein